VTPEPPGEASFYTCDRHPWFGTTNPDRADEHRKRMECELVERQGKIEWEPK
jgi:hypothetical protein